MNEIKINLDRYVGRPYQAGAEGPDAYDCYGLARSIAAERGLYLPPQASMDAVLMRSQIFAGEASAYLIPINKLSIPRIQGPRRPLRPDRVGALPITPEQRGGAPRGSWPDPGPGDLVVINAGRLGLHIATLLNEPGRMIHVAESTGTVRIERLDYPPYARNIYGFYRPYNQIRQPSAAARAC